MKRRMNTEMLFSRSIPESLSLLDDFGKKETHKEWQRNQQTVFELKNLLICAVDALERSDDWMGQPIHTILITKLREAAK